MSKRFLACLMAFVLSASLLGVAPAAAFADELEQDVPDNTSVQNKATEESDSIEQPDFEKPVDYTNEDDTDLDNVEPALEDIEIPVVPSSAPINTLAVAETPIDTLGSKKTSTVEVSALNANGTGSASMMSSLLDASAQIETSDAGTYVTIHFKNTTIMGQAVKGTAVTAVSTFDSDATAYEATMISADANTGDAYFKVFIPDVQVDTKMDMTYNGRASAVLLHLGTIAWTGGEGEGEEEEGEGGGEDDVDGDVDGQKDVEKSTLNDLIASVSSKKASDYNASSFAALASAISVATAIINKADVTQQEIDTQVKLLVAAINNLVPAQTGATNLPPTTNAFGLADGKYQVSVSLWHATFNQASMGDGSLNHTALLEVINGNMYLSISIHPMQVGNITTSLTNLQVRQPNGAYYSASPIAYNLAGGQPSAYRFAIYNLDSYLPVKVDPQVAIMGPGLLDARLLISWGSLTAVASSTGLSTNTQTAFSNYVLGETDVEDAEVVASLASVQPVKSSTTGGGAQTISDPETPLSNAPEVPFILIWGLIALAAIAVTAAIVTVNLRKARKQIKQ